MAKFSGNPPPNRQRAPLASSGQQVLNREGAPAYGLTPQAELFLLAATNMVGEDTFYEQAKNRDNRYTTLIHQVAQSDPGFILGDTEERSGGFARYLRNELNMRSAAVVLAAEYVRAGGPYGRQVVDAIAQRADEPAEMIGYWTQNYGRNIPQPIRRGVADAVRRLYTQRNVIRWDSDKKAVTFADVVELTHPKPSGPTQALLFKYLLDEAHHKDGSVENLELLAEDKRVLATPEAERRALLRTGGIPEVWNWERLAGFIPGGMDAEAWESVIPQMGVMALIRNLRNFDKVQISDKAVDEIIRTITDSDNVTASRIFPYQVWSAYREAPSDNYKRALGQTLELTIPNLPRLDGRTLVLIDTSSSMSHTLSKRGTVSRIEVASVMGAALGKRVDADIGIYASEFLGLEFDPGYSVLSAVQEIVSDIGVVGHATNLNTAIQNLYTGQDRVIVFTDDQAHDTQVDVSDVPLIYTFDLAGYGQTVQDNGRNGRYIFGGFSDATFASIPVLEAAGHVGWPF